MRILSGSKDKLSNYRNSHRCSRRNSQASASTKSMKFLKLKEFEVWLNGETLNGEYEGNDSCGGINAGVNGSGSNINDVIIFQQLDGTIERHFIKGACYQVVKNKRTIERLKNGGKYTIQKISDYGNDPEHGYTFRYLGKSGIHHTFVEINGGWSRTYTDAQLVGKLLVEVSEKEISTLMKTANYAHSSRNMLSH